MSRFRRRTSVIRRKRSRRRFVKYRKKYGASNKKARAARLRMNQYLD